MNQPSLFGDVPIARISDPETSHRAAEEVQPKLNRHQAAMLVAFGKPRTANEAAVQCERMFGGSRETYRKRKLELVRQQRITKVGVRTCTVTGKQAEVFRRTQQ